MTTAKYDELVRSLTGLNIALVDVNGEYRSTYDIMADIASKWESMSTMEQAALTDVVAGTRQQSVFFSLIGQFQEASGAMDSMASSANTLDEAYATYLDSTTAHINQFKAASQSLAANIFNSKFLSAMVDIGRVMLEFNDALVKTKAIFLALPAAFGISKFIKLKIAMASNVAQAHSLSASLIRQKTVSDQLSLSLSSLTAKQYEKIQSDLKAAWTSKVLTYEEYKQLSATVELIAGNTSLETSNFSLATSFRAVAAAIPSWGWFLIALTGITVAIGAATKAGEEMQKKFTKNTEVYKDSIEPLENYKNSIKEITESSDDMATKLSELGRIKDELSEKYDIQTGKIQNETQAVRDLNYELDKEIRNKRQIYLNENEEAYKNAYKKATDFVPNNYSTRKNLNVNDRDLKTLTVWRNSSYDTSEYDISDDIKKIFDKDSDFKSGKVSIGSDANNEIELLKAYEEAYIEFGRVKTRMQLKGIKLSKDEESLFDSLSQKYNILKDEVTNEEYGTENVLLSYAKAQAEELIAMYPKAGSSTEQWKKQLFALADGDEFVISSINNLINAMENLSNSSDPTNFELLNSALQLVEGRLENLKTSIETANDYFEDLAKTIKNNSDTDKFFTSAEIVELLETYPALNDAILETTYGYKIEEDALEELRKVKLEEQKSAILAQISETDNALNSAMQRLESYKAEIKGIKSLEQAKLELAKVDEQLAILNAVNNPNSQITGLINILSSRRSKVSGFIEASNEIEKLSEQLAKAKMQYTILGNVFDDAEDSTKDTTNAFNNQKNALKELTDEMKNAQDDINDLIKLTMDMIRKQKELSKDALKEQLDNFKKLIEKKKELIELEQSQYNFEKELKEQNRDLLEIQQELDALSVEGADYSLEDMKRKEELQDKLIEKQQDRTDFLYDHEVDVRKDALDKEQEDFEDNINTQIKAIEDYLKHEGWIRQQAVDLINGRTQSFYNDLYSYTLTYTDKSRFEFTKLWDDAYAALEKYGNGQIDVDLTLAFLIAQIANYENQIDSLDSKINETKNSINELGNAIVDNMTEAKKVTEEATQEMALLAELAKDATLQTPNITSAAKGTPQWVTTLLAGSQLAREFIYKSKIPKYHEGGLVEHQGITKNSEVFAKLMAGEVVITPAQAKNFMRNTLPKLASANTINNQMSPSITIGDINISGNADASTVSQLKEVQKEIVESVFKTINSQKNIFNGGKIRTV